MKMRSSRALSTNSEIHFHPSLASSPGSHPRPSIPRGNPYKGRHMKMNDLTKMPRRLKYQTKRVGVQGKRQNMCLCLAWQTFLNPPHCPPPHNSLHCTLWKGRLSEPNFPLFQEEETLQHLQHCVSQRDSIYRPVCIPTSMISLRVLPRKKKSHHKVNGEC